MVLRILYTKYSKFTQFNFCKSKSIRNKSALIRNFCRYFITNCHLAPIERLQYIETNYVYFQEANAQTLFQSLSTSFLIIYTIRFKYTPSINFSFPKKNLKQIRYL